MFQYDGKKYQRLRTRLDQLRAVNSDLAHRLVERQHQVRELEQNGVEISAAQFDTLTGWKSDIEFLRGELNSIQKKMADLSPAVSAIESWISNNRTQPDYNRPQPKAPKSTAKAVEQLAKIRADVAQLQQQRDAITCAPLPRAEAAKRISALIDQLAGEHRSLPGLIADAVAGVGISPDAFRLRGAAKADAAGVVEHNADLGPMLAWLFRDAIVQRLTAELPADDAAIPMAKRPSMLAKLDAQIAPLATEEEQLVAALEAAGETVARRADVDPLLVLGVREVPDPPEQQWRQVVPKPAPVKSQYIESGKVVRTGTATFIK